MAKRWRDGRKAGWSLWLVWLLLAANLIPAAAQPANGISTPAAGDTLSGVVVVAGTAVHPDYLRYELAFRRSDLPAGEWIVFAEGTQQVVDGTLAVWDTTVGRDTGSPVFPDGSYDLRLRVVRSDYNYDEYFTSGLFVSNSGPTPTPSPDATTAAEATSAASTAVPDGTRAFTELTPLPSLTPFPTPTALPAPERTPATPLENGDASAGDSSGGILGQLGAIDSSRFARAFTLGAVATGLVFGLLALYLLLRALIRRLWQAWWGRE